MLEIIFLKCISCNYPFHFNIEHEILIWIFKCVAVAVVVAVAEVVAVAVAVAKVDKKLISRGRGHP